MKNVGYCASTQRIAPRIGLSAALLLAAGVAYGQSEALLLNDATRIGGVAQVPYLADQPAQDEAIGVSWMPFESFLLNAAAQPLGNGSRSHLSGTWLGLDSVRVNAYADGANLQSSRWNAFGYCNSLALFTSGCAAYGYPAQLDGTQALNYGLRTQWEPLSGLSLGLGYRHQSATGTAADLLFPGALDFLTPGWNGGLRMPGARSADGVDIDMAYGFNAGFIGQVEFELRLSHELNRSLSVEGERLLDTRNWQSNPLSHASFGFNWNRGDFSGSLSSRYVDSIFLNGQPEPASWTSLDINFAWRTPWDASLSVGAKNLLGNEPPMAELSPDGPLSPELNEAFSSIPYVRYEQDL